MPTATIKVLFVNQPSGGRKSGSVKVEDGRYLNVPPAMLGQFQPNTIYNVEYTEKEGTGQWVGKKFYDIVRIVAPVANGATPGATAPAATSSFRPTDPATSENIFVCGAINSAIRAGQLNILNADDMAAALHLLRAEWKRSFGPAITSRPPPSPRPQARDDMGEEQIPY